MRAWINRMRRALWRLLWGRMLFGEVSQGRDLKNTRISPTTLIDHEDRLHLADHVYIGPFNWIEASAGVTLDEGVQITSHVSVVTHASHRSARLLGRAYVEPQGQGHARPGWIAAPVHIGAYSFVGPHTVIEAGTRLGRGTLVCAGSVVRGEFPDFAVLKGRPAQVVGDTRDTDERLLQQYPQARVTYEAWAGPLGAGTTTSSSARPPP